MKEFKFSARSLKALNGINPKLRKVVDLALELSPIDFIITEGKRDIATQRKYVKSGASQTMKSNHLTGNAIDYVAWYNGKVSYHYGHMKKISEAFFEASKQLGIPIVWGGNWKTLVDTPHIELKK